MAPIDGQATGSFQRVSVSANQDVVASRIEVAQARKTGLIQTVEALIAQLEALQPPDHPGKDAKAEKIAEYSKKRAAFQQQVADLNRQIVQAYRDIDNIDREIASLQGPEMSEAARKDCKAMQDDIESTSKRMETAIRSASTEDADDDPASGKEPSATRIAIRARERKIPLEGRQDLKTILQLVINFVGGSVDQVRDAVAMPRTPGQGLPPAGIP